MCPLTKQIVGSITASYPVLAANASARAFEPSGEYATMGIPSLLAAAMSSLCWHSKCTSICRQAGFSTAHSRCSCASFTLDTPT